MTTDATTFDTFEDDQEETPAKIESDEKVKGELSSVLWLSRTDVKFCCTNFIPCSGVDFIKVARMA